VAHLPGRAPAPDRGGTGPIHLTNSIAGLRRLAGVAHDTAAQHGVVGLMCRLAGETAPQHIRVNRGHPANVDTPIIQNDAVSGACRLDLDRPPREVTTSTAGGRSALAPAGFSTGRPAPTPC